MKITAISDLHGYKPELPGGDLLILAGDYTGRNKMKEWAEFFVWVKKQEYRKKIIVAGNHDGFFESGFSKNQKESDELKEVQSFLLELGEIEPEDFDYLCDSGVEFEGLKIWGTPWSLWFKEINPKCKAFTGSEACLGKKYQKIPEDIDILISHGPPFGILDHIYRYNGSTEYCGSHELKKAIERVKPLYIITAHIHENGGEEYLYKHEGKNTQCYNVSHCDEFYRPRKKILNFEI